MDLKYIIKRPIITEKSLGATKDNKYTFEVAAGATKDQIKAAVKNAFQVDVVTVHTATKKPTIMATGRRRKPGMTSLSKKTIVEIKPGQSIKVFETKG